MPCIAQMGFSPLAAPAVQREPLVVDWDELEAQRVRVLPQPRRRELVAT